DALNVELIDSVKTDSRHLCELAQYTLNFGGKRIRPVFLFLSYMLCGHRKLPDSVKKMALVVELMHTATLVHDDIIDNATLRRGRESVQKKFGLSKGLLCGDFFLTKAFGLCSDLPTYIRKATEDCAIKLIEGETDELETDVASQFDEILRIATFKTASLFSLCGRAGAFFANADERIIELCAEFGQICGLAFQVLDDIFDVIGQPDKTGKARGVDLRERKPSIVIHFWLQTNSEVSQAYIENDPNLTIEIILEDLMKSDALTLSYKFLLELVQRAELKTLLLNKNQDIHDLFQVFFQQFKVQSEFHEAGLLN
ncbi:MAG: polyprenyl synthetase family protein, partial [Deltaproteobacteria bacterium]|nr:polyprenyl synthetase family protein [Deltaproteobacteria bacterium]